MSTLKRWADHDAAVAVVSMVAVMLTGASSAILSELGGDWPWLMLPIAVLAYAAMHLTYRLSVVAHRQDVNPG